jgi:hypothetical protein
VSAGGRYRIETEPIPTRSLPDPNAMCASRTLVSIGGASDTRAAGPAPVPDPETLRKERTMNRIAKLVVPAALALAAFGAQAEGFAPSAGGVHKGPVVQASSAAPTPGQAMTAGSTSGMPATRTASPQSRDMTFLGA